MAAVGPVVSSPVCPPLVRPAPGSSSFSPCFIPLPPAHYALGLNVVGVCPCSFVGGGHLTRHVSAGASVAWPGSSSSFASVVGVSSSVCSRGSFHPAGPCRLPSRRVASTRRSVSFGRVVMSQPSRVVMLLLLHSSRQVWHPPNHHTRSSWIAK